MSKTGTGVLFRGCCTCSYSSFLTSGVLTTEWLIEMKTIHASLGWCLVQRVLGKQLRNFNLFCRPFLKMIFLARLTLWCQVSEVFLVALPRLKVEAGYLCAYEVVLTVVTLSS